LSGDRTSRTKHSSRPSDIDDRSREKAGDEGGIIGRGGGSSGRGGGGIEGLASVGGRQRSATQLISGGGGGGGEGDADAAVDALDAAADAFAAAVEASETASEAAHVSRGGITAVGGAPGNALFLQGMTFHIEKRFQGRFTSEKSSRDAAVRALRRHGGCVAGTSMDWSSPHITHHVVEDAAFFHRYTDTLRHTTRNEKRLVTWAWVEACLRDRRVLPLIYPASVVYQPQTSSRTLSPIRPGKRSRHIAPLLSSVDTLPSSGDTLPGSGAFTLVSGPSGGSGVVLDLPSTSGSLPRSSEKQQTSRIEIDEARALWSAAVEARALWSAAVQEHKDAVLVMVANRHHAKATKSAWDAAGAATVAADTELRQAVWFSTQTRMRIEVNDAVEAARPPPLTHPPSAPGAHGVFPPTKVGGAIDWPWHDAMFTSESLKYEDFEFVAQINLAQVTGRCTLLPTGLLPAAGILYFFVTQRYDELEDPEEPEVLDWNRSCSVLHYNPGDDAPPWPAPLPLGALNPESVRSCDIFGPMRTSMETYRNAAPAAAGDILTVPPYPIHELMSEQWRSWDGGNDGALLDSHPDWNVQNRYEAEITYINSVCEMAAVPCHTPMLLGHCNVPEAGLDQWSEMYGDLGESPLGDKYDEGKVCLLQLMPHGPEGCFVAFFATEAEIRERRWDAVEVMVIPCE